MAAFIDLLNPGLILIDWPENSFSKVWVRQNYTQCRVFSLRAGETSIGTFMVKIEQNGKPVQRIEYTCVNPRSGEEVVTDFVSGRGEM